MSCWAYLGASGSSTCCPRVPNCTQDVKMESPGVPNHCSANPASHQLTGHQGASCTSRLFRKCGNVCFPCDFLREGQYSFVHFIARKCITHRTGKYNEQKQVVVLLRKVCLYRMPVLNQWFAKPPSHQMPVDRGPAAEGVALNSAHSSQRGCRP